MIMYVLLKVMECRRVTQTVIFHLISSSLYDGCFYLAIGSVVTRLLLIIAGDIEVNPGPVVNTEELTRSLATLITEAPAGVKPVLGVWAPDKGDMVAEWNSSKFTVPVLKEAMAWLQNATADEVGKQLKKKLDLATALPVAIERLLPDECGSCNTMYTVCRVDKPTLQCAGCHQGIHEECLKELLGEGTATLSTLHGSLTWLCQTCSPNYRMMTVLLPGGPQRPVSRRQGSIQSIIPPTVAPAVDEIADRLAAMSVSQGEPSNPNPINVQETAGKEDTDVTEDVTAGAGPPTQGVDCQLFLKGECPFGISGKRGGVCTAVHRKRCARFMRWGSMAVKGCKEISCANLHPAVCPASLNLLCTDQSCAYKVHVYKCKRRKTGSSDKPNKTARASGSSKDQSVGAKKHVKRPKIRPKDGLSGGKPSDKASDCAAAKCHAATACHAGPATDCVASAACHGNSCGRGADSEYPGQTKHVQAQPEAVGFQTATVQPMLEAWMEGVKKEMIQKQELMFQMLRMEMMQPRAPMLGRGAYGLLPSF